MFVARLRSFNAMEQELRQPRRWEAWVGKRKPSADTLGYTLCRFALDSLRQVLLSLNREAWRMKAIHCRAGQSLRVVAIDGHELFSSQARCCDECLEREVEIGGKKVKVYYHRVVVAQWVGVTPPAILDLELLSPGEGEVVAARRLLDRVLSDYSRLLDVISADALYLEAPFIRKILEAGKHFVIVMKQEARDLYKDADQLRALLEPKVIEEGPRTSHIWDLPGLNSFATLGRPVRVVWSEERTVKSRFVGGKKEQVTEEKTWIWVSDLPTEVTPATLIQRWGHDRWDLENRGFNELGQLWAMNHAFVHDPTAIQAILLTLAVAFLTTYLFYERNLKPALRKHLTRLALASKLKEDLCSLRGASLWPGLEFSG